MNERVWNIDRIILTEKNQHSEKNLAQCHSVHHKSHTGWPTSEPGHLWRKVQD